MKQERHDKLKASFEASLPQLPSDFTEQVMRQTDAPRRRVVRWRWAAAVAACLILLAGVGITMLCTEESPNNQEYAQVTPTEGKSEGSGDRNADPVLGQVPVPMTPTEIIAQPLPSHQGEGCPKGGVGSVISHQGEGSVISPPRNGRRAAARSRVKHELPDTLGSGIWQSEANVQRAVQMLADCEATIRREEQQVRNDIIEATFRATPQPANAILVSNEAGDYEVIETRNIIEI